MSDVEKQSESPAPRREFLKQGFVALSALAMAGAIPPEAMAAEKPAKDIPTPSHPFRSQKILKNETTGKSPREQSYVESEIIGANGVKTLTKVYVKKTEFEDSYDVVTIVVSEYYVNATDVEPFCKSTATSSATAIKGEVEGDRRNDTITTTFVSPAGVTSDGPRKTRVFAKDPTEGMNDSQKQAFLDQHIANHMKGQS